MGRSLSADQGLMSVSFLGGGGRGNCRVKQTGSFPKTRSQFGNLIKIIKLFLVPPILPLSSNGSLSYMHYISVLSVWYCAARVQALTRPVYRGWTANAVHGRVFMCLVHPSRCACCGGRKKALETQAPCPETNLSSTFLTSTRKPLTSSENHIMNSLNSVIALVLPPCLPLRRREWMPWVQSPLLTPSSVTVTLLTAEGGAGNLAWVCNLKAVRLRKSHSTSKPQICPIGRKGIYSSSLLRLWWRLSGRRRALHKTAWQTYGTFAASVSRKNIHLMK